MKGSAVAKKSLPATIDDTPLETIEQRAQLMFTHLDDKNKVQATIANLRDLLVYHGIVCRYNVISKKVIHNIPGEEFTSENEENAAIACIYSLMKQWSMPVDGHRGYLLRIADENQYNPVMQWITSKPWDGKGRLQEFYDTIESTEKEAKELLIRRWMITAVCMACQHGVDSAGCLVLQGNQDMGKTWWAKKLVPEDIRAQLIRTDATVDPHDKDSVSQVISYWIVELGEIGATFNRADLQALKAFITRDHDTMRRPYDLGDSRYPRRTALIASVDQQIYLHDTAGNRRFWTIPCTSINSFHTLDMQQVWSEVYELVKGGETWRLEPDEKAHIARINEQHAQIEPIYEKIRDYYNWEYECSDAKSATEIAEAIGLKNVTQKETRAVTTFVLKLNGNQRENGGKKRLRVPYKI